MTAGDASPDAIVAFWFAPATRRHWFNATAAFDRDLRQRFEPLWRRAAAGELGDWEQDAVAALALVIVLDQFPLNMFRGRPEGFATEQMSREVAARAIERGLDRELAPEQRAFLYLPFMHSESLADQERSVALFSQPGLEANLKWAHHHREIVRRFGRFPHRNAILGRASSAEECAWLASDDAFRG